MKTKYKIIASMVLLTIAFAFGRYSAPEKVKEVTKNESSEHKDLEKDKNKDIHEHKKTKTVVIKKPDGTEKTITVIDSTKNTASKDKTVVSSDKATKAETEKETTYSKNKVFISVLAAENINNFTPSPVYGGMISKQVLGPITFGGFGLANGIVGASLGLSF